MSTSRDDSTLSEDPKSSQEPNVVASPPSPPPAFPFDRVVLTEGGSVRTLSPAEFFALPLAQRIQFVVQQKAAFFAHDEQLDAKQALGQLRKIRARLH